MFFYQCKEGEDQENLNYTKKKKKNPLIAFPATFWMSCFPLEVSLRLILEEAAGIVGKLTILAAA